MNKNYIVTYCNDPENFDIVRLIKKGEFIETELVSTSEKDYQILPGEKRFFSPSVWKNKARLEPSFSSKPKRIVDPN